MAIQDSCAQFQQNHLPKCTFIPSDIRKCYEEFKSQEEKYHNNMMAADDPFLWVSSAIQRGLQDIAEGGGIGFCPELKSNQDLESSTSTEQELESCTSTEHQLQSSIGYLEEYVEPEEDHKLTNIQKPHKNDVLVGRGGLANTYPGNKHWRELMKDIRPEYNVTIMPTIGNSGKKKKSALARLVVEAVRTRQSPPGRFLAQDKETDLWNDIGDKEARKKTSQALRDLGKVRHNGSKKRMSVMMHNDMHTMDARGSAATMATIKDGNLPRGNSLGLEVTNIVNEEIGEWIIEFDAVSFMLVLSFSSRPRETITHAFMNVLKHYFLVLCQYIGAKLPYSGKETKTTKSNKGHCII